MDVAIEVEVSLDHAQPQSVSILGATGTIGQATLDVMSCHPLSYKVQALTACRNWQKLAELSLKHQAQLAVIGDPSKYDQLKQALAGSGIEVAAGEEAIIEAASRPADCYMAAIVGAAGLRPTFAAAAQGSRIALANKECLVSAGALFMAEMAKAQTEVIPVDSEHSAVFQILGPCLGEPSADEIERLILTASGGPFRSWSMEQLEKATLEQALSHPNWSMGDKITIDSATLMNKGLELIEAYHLFPVNADQLDILVHPQSIVHCLVEYSDKSCVAQLSAPDMRIPIAYSLAWPARIEPPSERLNLAALGTLTFEAADEQRFPALRIAREALYEGGLTCTVLNAVNEIAVEAFISHKIGFLGIAAVVEKTLNQASRLINATSMSTLDEIIDVDREARKLAQSLL